jgi:hypothetical protein
VVTRRSLLAFALAAIAVAVLFARPRPTPGPVARDFESYWAAGAAWNAHADPYGRAVWNAERTVPGVDAQRDELLPFVGPPATLLVWSLFARLPYAIAAGLWSALLGLAVVALVACALRASAAHVSATTFLTALALAIAFGPVTSDFALGQLALPAFLGATLVVLYATRSVALATPAAWLAFAQPNAALGLISQLGRNRTTLAIVMGAVAAYTLGAVAANWAWPIEYSRVLAAHADAERFVAIQLSPASIAYGFGAAPRAAEVIGIITAVLAAAAAMALALRVRDRYARFAAFSALSPFAAGFFHEHDLVVAYAGVLWCALRTRATTRVVALVGTLLVAIDWLGLAQRPTGVAQSCLLASAAFAAFVALGERLEQRATLVTGFALAVVLAGAAWIGSHHPVPIWPDALGAFHAAASAGPATTWNAEQRVSGLLAAVPAWAALRSLSLLGSGLLAYAIYRHSAYCRTA